MVVRKMISTYVRQKLLIFIINDSYGYTIGSPHLQVVQIVTTWIDASDNNIF